MLSLAFAISPLIGNHMYHTTMEALGISCFLLSAVFSVCVIEGFARFFRGSQLVLHLSFLLALYVS